MWNTHSRSNAAAAVQAHFLPTLTTPEQLAGGVVVVIDVLRASTTICTALAAGAREVIPCLEADEARQLAAKFPREQVVLGGERGGLRIDGFDLGNSPAEYTPESVGGKTVIFTTTNGTRAMMQCRQARRVLVGAFVNLSAVCRELATACQKNEAIHLLCAGRRGEITADDVPFAGALAARCQGDCQFNDQADLAMRAWLNIAGQASGKPAASELAEYLARHSAGGRHLRALGLEADIRFAAQIDRFDFVPELDLRAWRIIV